MQRRGRPGRPQTSYLRNFNAIYWNYCNHFTSYTYIIQYLFHILMQYTLVLEKGQSYTHCKRYQNTKSNQNSGSNLSAPTDWLSIQHSIIHTSSVCPRSLKFLWSRSNLRCFYFYIQFLSNCVRIVGNTVTTCDKAELFCIHTVYHSR